MRFYYLYKIRNFFSFYLFTSSSSSSLTLSSPSFNSIPSFHHFSPSLFQSKLDRCKFGLSSFWFISPFLVAAQINIKNCCKMLFSLKGETTQLHLWLWIFSRYPLDILWKFSPQSPEKINIVTMHIIGNCKKEKTLCTLIRVGDWFPLARFQPNWRPPFPPSGHSLMQSSCLFRYGQQPLLEEDIK